MRKTSGLQDPTPPRGGSLASCLRPVGLALPLGALLLATCDFQEKFEAVDREMDAVGEMLAEARVAEAKKYGERAKRHLAEFENEAADGLAWLVDRYITDVEG